jgi:hypothetical protein
LFIALLWAVVPLLPSLARGELPGAPYTDLYPSVWGLDVFISGLPGFPTHTTRMGAPDGIGFYYSSPLHGFVGWPVHAAFGPDAAYIFTLVVARAATVWVAWEWLTALGRPRGPALAGALLFGASPFFQGYAAEGIVEGTDGWALAFWAWATTARRPGLAALGLALSILSSWYLGMVACTFAVLASIRLPTARWSLLGLLAAPPALWAFHGAFGGNQPLGDTLRVAMGAPLQLAKPWLAAPSPFALNTFVGVSTVVLAWLARHRSPVFAAGALLCFVLSTGRGPWWALPVLELVRFPYRWHAGTLLCLAALVAALEVRPVWLFLPWLEGLLLGPIAPILPGSPRVLPPIYEAVEPTRLLELPGPLALPPGVLNPSRPRARWFLYAQLRHGAASPWTLDFNGVATDRDAPWLDSFRSWDPTRQGERLPPDVAAARAAGVAQALVHRDLYGKADARALEAALVAAGATAVADDGERALYRF